MKLGCVIMASGEGKRFGSNKMLADIYGEPLIARTIDSVPGGFDVVVWKGCLFLPGDQPLVSSDSFEALAGAFKANGGVAPVRLALNGEPASPVLFPASFFPNLMGLKGKDGGSSLLRGRADVQLVEARAYELWDVDTAKGQRRVSEHIAACSYFDRVANCINQ